MLSDVTQREILELARGWAQVTDDASGNLGFGNVYYAMARLYQPEVMVCIGSLRGFAPICFALGLRANRKGICYFIDPGKMDGYWHDAAGVEALARTFGVQNHWRHLFKTTQQVVAEQCLPTPIDLLYIDGDHSYQGVKYDFDHLSPLMSPEGLILLHDSTETGDPFVQVKRFLETEVYGMGFYDTFTFPFGPGLTLLRRQH